MSYQVLARKWRPKQFTEMVGQGHVLKALVNALDDNRLHHAYLFTGTRGVGKTSIARLFAKALNCEQGVSSKPCGHCGACTEIAEGRFVDLIEVDAASRTKVEDTRELLENVQYAPSRGRFKVYLIDEVHMLSKSSFNALLKTLEEPPPHVKFLLATTDPQKLPVTVLSRCLQFNLKNMIPQRIVEHLNTVLTAEQIPFEEPALWLLARSADGSMRDALSLTDQSIAFGAGSVSEADVRVMLGTIDLRLVYHILSALVKRDGAGLLKCVEDLAQFSPDYNTVLGDIVSLLHRIAIAQTVPSALDNSMGDQQQVLELAGQLSAEDVQLFYQIALMGRKDLPFVPDAREGLEMTLMRMLAFRPAQSSHTAPMAPLVAGKLNAQVSENEAGKATQVSSSVAVSGLEGEKKNETSSVDSPLAISEQPVDGSAIEKPAEVSSSSESIIESSHDFADSESVNLPVKNNQESLREPLQEEVVNQANDSSPSPLRSQESLVSNSTLAAKQVLPQVAEAEVIVEAEIKPEIRAEVASEIEAPKLAPKSDQPVDAFSQVNGTQVNSTQVNSAPEVTEYPQEPLAENEKLLVDTPPWEDDYQAYQNSEKAPASNKVEAEVKVAVKQEFKTEAKSVEVKIEASANQINVSRMLDAPVTEYSQLNLDAWPSLVGAVGFTGMTAHIAENLSLESIQGTDIEFNVSKVQKNVLDQTQKDRIQSMLSDYFSRELRIGYDSAQSTRETPWQCFEKLRAKRLRQAISSFQADEMVQQLVSVFSGEIDRSSIMPVD